MGKTTRSMDFRSYKLETPSLTVIELTGQIDSVKHLDPVVEVATSSETGHVAILMEKIEYINSRGCGGLIALHHRVEDRGFRVFIVNPVGGVARVMRQVGCHKILRIRESLEEVIQEVREVLE